MDVNKLKKDFLNSIYIKVNIITIKFKKLFLKIILIFEIVKILLN